MLLDIIENSKGKDKISMSEETFFYLDKLRTWMFSNVYTNHIAKHEENKVYGIIRALFDYYEKELKKRIPDGNEEAMKRTVCDYIAGMTDRYAIQKYQEIFIPQSIQNSHSDEFLFTLAKLNGLGLN